jgi:hypothetical protein
VKRATPRRGEYFEQSRGPRYLIEILDAGHFSFSDMFQINPTFGNGIGEGERITRPGERIVFRGMEETYDIINSASVAFFGVYVKDQAGYADALDAHPWDENVIVRAVRPEPAAEATATASAGPAAAAVGGR